jgi:hypothetical protein
MNHIEQNKSFFDSSDAFIALQPQIVQSFVNPFRILIITPIYLS